MNHQHKLDRGAFQSSPKRCELVFLQEGGGSCMDVKIFLLFLVFFLVAQSSRGVMQPSGEADLCDVRAKSGSKREIQRHFGGVEFKFLRCTQKNPA